MKRSFISIISGIFILSLVFSLNIRKAEGQTVLKDSCVMGAGYANDVYYTFSNGNKVSVPANNWDLGIFVSQNEMEIAGIRINTVNGVKLYAYTKSDTTGWTGLDTAGIKSWKSLENSYSKWNFGAFNANTTVQFDYGWGKYNFTTHNVVGDSLFVIKLDATTYKKIWIVENDAVNKIYHIRYANLDNTKDTTVAIEYMNKADQNIIYYSIKNNAIVDREPKTNAWDVVFTTVEQELAPGYFMPVVSVLSNNYKALTAKLSPVNVENALYSMAVFNNNISEIGTSWKEANAVTHKYDIIDSTVYFVKDILNHNNIYKLLFLKAGGSGGGIETFTKEVVFTSISENKNINEMFVIYPNPVKEYLNIIYDFKSDKNLTVSIFNLLGEKLTEINVPASGNSNKLSVSTLPVKYLVNGTYIVKLSSDNITLSRKFIVSK